jgi:hypothetical protein
MDLIPHWGGWLMGTRFGILKVAAKKCGLPLSEYQSLIAAGLKRCTFCTEWKSTCQFGVDATRWDGWSAGCTDCRRGRGQESHDPIGRMFRLPSGPARIARRLGDKKQAKSRINHDVSLGLRPNPNDLYCAKCGHIGSDRRHEYHHIMGYAEEHHYDVLPLCSACHHKEHPRHG